MADNAPKEKKMKLYSLTVGKRGQGGLVTIEGEGRLWLAGDSTFPDEGLFDVSYAADDLFLSFSRVKPTEE